MQRVRVQLSGPSITGPAVATTFHTGTSQADASAAASAAADFWNAVFSAGVRNGTEGVVEPTVANIDPATGLIQSEVAVSPPAITSAPPGDTGAKATQALVTWRTGAFVNGKPVQGRTFIPAIGATFITGDGALNASIVTQFSDAAAAFVGNAASLLGVWHRPNDLGPGSVHLAIAGESTNRLSVLRSRRD